MVVRSASQKPVHRSTVETRVANTWIVAADSSRARFLQVAGRRRLVEVESLPKDLSWLNERQLKAGSLRP